MAERSSPRQALVTQPEREMPARFMVGISRLGRVTAAAPSPGISERMVGPQRLMPSLIIPCARQPEGSEPVAEFWRNQTRG